MSESDQPYQVMPDFDDEEYQRLKKDIRENGVEYPIIVDTDDNIIDGHHRYQIWVDLGRDPDDLPTRVVDDTSTANLHRAYRTNLNRRDLSDGTKRDAVKQYLLEHPDRVTEDTQQAIAEDLGVSPQTVTNALDEIPDDVKKSKLGKLSTDEKREQVREFVEDNPSVSDREVAREVDCDVSHVTVGKWRDEWGIEEPTTGLDRFNNSKTEGDTAREVANKATDEKTDEEVREFAEQKAEEIAQNKTTPDSAARKVSTRERVVEGERNPIRTTDDDVEETQTQDDDTDEGPLKVLNLYAGIGGNRQLWDDVEVTAVEWDEDTAEIYRDHFPDDDVVVADAHEYLREHIFDGWDYIWSSPPCPTHSRTNHFTQVQHESAQYPDMQLYEEILLLDHLHEQLGYDYTVENVVSYYDPLIEPQEVADHYFWTTINIPDFETESRNILSDADGRDAHFDFEREQRRLGFELDEYDIPQSRKEKTLRNCVNPDLGRHILNQVGVNDDERHSQVRATNRGESDE